MKLNLRMRVILIIMITVFIIGCLLIPLTRKITRKEYTSIYHMEVLEMLQILANDIDGDAIVSMVESGEKDDTYEELQRRFNVIKTKSVDMEYLYLVVPYDTYFIYVVEAQSERDNPDALSYFGKRYDYVDFDYEYFVPDVQNGRASDQPYYLQYEGAIYSDSFTVWVPVLGSDGKTAAMIEADINLARTNAMIANHMKNIIILMIILLIALILILFLTLSRAVVLPIRVLTQEVDSYENGRYEPSDYQFKYDDELKLLSNSFHEMIGRIDYYVEERAREAVEKEHLVAELNLASRIQSSYLPSVFPAFPERHDFELYASMTPAKDVGGDFYDFFMPDDDHIILVIADVSGKGIPAALFMMASKMAIRNAANFETRPSKILENANMQIIANNPENMFVTVWLGCVELSTGRLTYANAGHNRTLLLNGGSWEYVEKPCGLPLAVMENFRYKEFELLLDRGSFLFQYTDGVTEAERADCSQFGKERLLEVAQGLDTLEPQAVLTEIRARVDEFVEGAPQFDDITMLGFYLRGQTPNESL